MINPTVMEYFSFFVVPWHHTIKTPTKRIFLEVYSTFTWVCLNKIIWDPGIYYFPGYDKISLPKTTESTPNVYLENWKSRRTKWRPPKKNVVTGRFVNYDEVFPSAVGNWKCKHWVLRSTKVVEIEKIYSGKEPSRLFTKQINKNKTNSS